MKTFVWIALKYLELMNLVLIIGTLMAGGNLSFNLITNLTMPVICAYVEYEAKAPEKAASHPQK